MKKRIIIGDLHGLQIWKDIIEKENPDIAIFLGDYFDSFNLTPLVQKLNFDNLIEYTRNHETILLLGNHDYHYIFPTPEQYSGYNQETQNLIGYSKNIIKQLFDEGLIKLVYIDNINHTIYSHAGVSNKWMEAWNIENDFSNIKLDHLKFTYKDGGDWYGSSIYSSPIWIRPEGLLKFPYRDKEGKIWHQVFGHTNKIQPIKDIKNDAEFWNLDCLQRGYYMVEKMSENGKIFERIIKQI